MFYKPDKDNNPNTFQSWPKTVAESCAYKDTKQVSKYSIVDYATNFKRNRKSIFLSFLHEIKFQGLYLLLSRHSSSLTKPSVSGLHLQHGAEKLLWRLREDADLCVGMKAVQVRGLCRQHVINVLRKEKWNQTDGSVLICTAWLFSVCLLFFCQLSVSDYETNVNLRQKPLSNTKEIVLR